jgi:hypothetical protein
VFQFRWTNVGYVLKLQKEDEIVNNTIWCLWCLNLSLLLCNFMNSPTFVRQDWNVYIYYFIYYTLYTIFFLINYIIVTR